MPGIGAGSERLIPPMMTTATFPPYGFGGMKTSNPHATLDLATGNCLDCGASREEIDGNLAPICDRLTGPNRLAMIVLRREQRRRDAEINHLHHQMLRDEAALRALHVSIENKQAELREITATWRHLCTGD